MKMIRVLALFGLILLFASACVASPDALTPDDQVAIYSAVVRQVTGPDDTFGGTLEKPVIYIISKTSDSAGDPAAADPYPEVLTSDIQEGISANLSDLPSTIVWVDDRDQVELDENGAVVGGGAIVTLGNIHPQDKGQVHVAGGIYVASLAAGGQTYVLEKQDGIWTVTGNTGVQWIS